METRLDRYLKWCLTKSGKKVIHGFNIAVNIGIFSALYMPQTFFLEKYKNLVQLFKDGEPAPVPESIKSLYEEVLNDLNIHKADRKFMEPFMVFGFDTFQAGIPDTKTGGIFGVPINFTFTKARDLEPSRLIINDAPVDWARQETEDLAQALVLSRDAQKFAIAREIRSFQESGRIIDSVMACTLFVASNTFCHWMKHRFDMYKKSLSTRIFLYTVAGFTGLSLYFIQKDARRKRVEKKVDEELSKLSPSYVKGGHEFYTKLLQRNIAHRALLGENGKELFDEDGNPVFFIRQKMTPLTKRKSLFEMKIEEFMKEQKNALNSELANIAANIEKA